MNEKQILALRQVLSSLPAATAAKIAFAVERDMLAGGSLPHDEILSELRPALRLAAALMSRVPSAQRLFCVAFEDLLTVRPRRRKQAGRIARASIAPFWTWLKETAMPGEAARLEGEITAKILSTGAASAGQDIAAFQKAAAAAILHHIPSADAASAPFKRAAEALGGPEIAADVYDMARMLEAAPELLMLQRKLPRPVPALTAPIVSVVQEWFYEFEAKLPGITGYLAFMIMGRLERPCEVLRLAGALSNRMDDVLVSRTAAGLVGEALLADMEDAAADLMQMRPVSLDASAAIDCVRSFAQLSGGIVRELGIKREGLWGKRMMAARATVAEAMDKLLSRAVKDINNTLPTQRAGGFAFKARRKPDLGKAADMAKQARAAELARLVAGCRIYAGPAAFASLLNEVDEEASDLVRRFTTEMLDDLRNPGAYPPDRADLHVAHALALSDILLGPDETGLIRRRVSVARQESGSNRAGGREGFLVGGGEAQFGQKDGGVFAEERRPGPQGSGAGREAYGSDRYAGSLR